MKNNETLSEKIARLERELAGIKEEAAKSGQLKIPLPKQGETFEYRGIEFVALEERDGGIFAVVLEPLEDEMPFDTGKKNDWRSSSLREYLNGEWLDDNLDKSDLLEFETDLTSLGGNTNYGKSRDYVSLLTIDDRRRLEEYLPKYDIWMWTPTPWYHPSHSNLVYNVNSTGEYYISSAFHALGSAPACLFNLDIFQSEEDDDE